MKKALKIGFLSVALAQSLCAVDAQFWWQLDEANNTNPPPQNPVLPSDPLVIWENSILNLQTVQNPRLGFDLYDGSITFDHNLILNLDVRQRQDATKTTIYRLNTPQNKIFQGNGQFRLNIDATNGIPARSIFELDRGTLISRVKTWINATENSQMETIYIVKGPSTLEIYDDFYVDLSKAQGNFEGNRALKAVFDTGGTLNINPDNNTQPIFQINGDMKIWGGRVRFNFLNSQSFYRGKIWVGEGGSNTQFNFSNGATSDIVLNVSNASPFMMSLNNHSSAKVRVVFEVENGTNTVFNVNNSSLFADFDYQVQNQFTYQGSVALDNRGVWYLSKANTIDVVEIKNDIGNITRDNFETLQNLSAIDMRYSDQGNTLRNDFTMTQANRYLLKTSQIRGGNGVFRIFGVLNQGGWTRELDPAGDLVETIATDQIITGRLFNTHYMQVFWNANNLDKSMLNKNLEEHKIIVAKQNNIATDSEIIGEVTPIGLYNYITSLKKEQMTFTQDDGTQAQGWQWIVSDIQRADNSYLSRLLDSLFQSQYRVFKMESDTFNQRMGELRDMERVHGIWLRTKYGRFGSKSTSQTAPSWDEFTSVWAGYDQNFTVLGGKNFLGFALNTTAFRNHGIAEDKDFSGESYYASSRSYGISIYDTYIFDNGLYIDGLLKYYLTDNRMSIRSEVLANNYPKFLTHGLVGSLEVGKKFRLPIKTPDFANSFYYLRPELQMTLGFVSGSEWTFKDWSNQNVKAQLDYDIPANFRAGLMFGREFNKSYIKGDVYLGTSFEYDVNTGGDLRLEDFLDKMTLTHKGNFTWRINVGTNLILNEYWRIYVDLDTSFFGQISSTFTLNGGVRINFGQLHPKMPYVRPDQEVFDPSIYRKDRRTIPEVQNYETQGILDNLSGKRKKPIYKPPVKIKSRPFGGEKQITTPPNYSATPQVQQPKDTPVFIDNPSVIQAPEKNYKRDATTPISPNVIPQNQRDMQSIQEGLNQGYRR